MANVLMLGDIVGDAGIYGVRQTLPLLMRQYHPDIIVANGENAASGIGLTKLTADALFEAGVDVITSGNHIWEKAGAPELLQANERILRPANYPSLTHGKGLVSFEKNGCAFTVLNMQGRESMRPIDSPFDAADVLLKDVSPERIIIVDFHAESFAEKEALALYLDGRAQVFAGTHTHVQTADERILPRGLGYIGDLGMSGPSDSVIGMRTDVCIRRNLTQMPLKMETASGTSIVCGALFTLARDEARGSWKCVSIKRIRLAANGTL